MTDETIRYTNEDLTKKFESPFDLVNYAIALGDNFIKSGRGAKVKTAIHNPAYVVLREIREGVDEMVDVYDEDNDYDRGAISNTQWQNPAERGMQAR